MPWTAAYIDTIGDPTCDLRSNIAAEARAKIVYERLMNFTPDAGLRDALGFLMTREIAHQKSFEKALSAIEPNFPPGKRPGDPRFTDKYIHSSHGDGDARGPWNQGASWEYVDVKEPKGAIDGGPGDASVELPRDAAMALDAFAARVASSRATNPVIGADLGAGAGKPGGGSAPRNPPPTRKS